MNGIAKPAIRIKNVDAKVIDSNAPNIKYLASKVNCNKQNRSIALNIIFASIVYRDFQQLVLFK